jgi:hypothetical protein
MLVFIARTHTRQFPAITAPSLDDWKTETEKNSPRGVPPGLLPVDWDGPQNRPQTG